MGSFLVVGDDDQSIYGWRGARMENILEFDREFPDATIVRLEENYRCRPQILDLANRLILNNTERREKTLTAARAPGVPPRFLEIDDEVDEATYIAREIRAAVDSPAPRDITRRSSNGQRTSRPYLIEARSTFTCRSSGM